ncbi:MAG: polysaccharide deacetylase family protein, partial [Caldilineales bacterium]|nr:polysaccharide deacetylase family protein [Caldilineales bacterium]
VVGRHVQRAPAALRAVVEAGHCVANHTHTHRSLRGLAPEDFAAEVRATEEAVRAALGDREMFADCGLLLRPPGGRFDAATVAVAADLGYRVVLWDIDPKDWRRPGAEAIADFVLRRAFPGAVVVLHDGGGGSRQTVAAVETILRELSSQGYVFRALTHR